MRYFKENEFVMGDENVFHKMDADLLHRLDLLRELVNEPLSVTSSFRSKEYNKGVGGSKRSQHLTGNAVDLSCNNSTLRGKIVKNALELGLTCGVAKTFVHIDNRDNQIVFTY
jgi:uncharacterized protein YcbK (DUF882 family)